MKIDIILLPKETTAMDLSDTVCIVLDIFRATTSIVTGLANGCKAIAPALSIEDARTLASQMGPVLLAGERQSIKIEGYDLGNSPFEFCQDTVKDRSIVMTTTNGTIAIKATEGAYRTLIGSFVNAKAVCRQAKQYGKDIVIVCAGLLVQLLTAENDLIMTDSAQGALLMYTAAKENLVAMAVKSRNGKRLYDIDRMNDVEYCLHADQFNIVPQYIEGKIVLDNQ